MMHKTAALAVLAGGIILASGGAAVADSGATGAAVGSPGVLSGNVIEVPIDIPVNACGDSVDLIGLLNPTAGDTCVNG
ncbi:chaplin [Streptomyces sp. NPDC020917]|uniref:chaplin n=1 Tax=Streptomyces sp. NPDC020917 TaxID=3365102 RepID=UPI00379575EA